MCFKFLFKKKKNNEDINMSETSKAQIQLKEFTDYYGGINFSKISFRPGASFTNDFGLTERYKIINGKAVWGYPGLHRGNDRSGARTKKLRDPVICPFNFGSSGYIDHKGRYTGTDCLFYHRFNFRLKVGHMFPDEIEIKDKLMAGYSIKQGTHVGKAGTYGFSTGDHTHTEIESWGYNGEWAETCEMLDLLLLEKYGDEVKNSISSEEIIKVYNDCPKTKSWKIERIFEDFSEIKKVKKILFLNKHKLIYKDHKDRMSTRYNSESLFGM